MAITYFRYDDTGAPATPASSVDFVALIATILTTGYGSKAGAGWTIVYDDSAANGDLILKDPDGTHYVLTPYASNAMELGMCITADGTGAKTNYRSGTYCSGAGYRQRMTGISSGSFERWYAFYDDASHTLFIRAMKSNIDDWNYGRNSSVWDDQLSIYMGSLTPPVAGAYAPKVIFGGTHAQYNDQNYLFQSNWRAYAPDEGHAGTILNPYADETLSGQECAFVPVAINNKDSSAPNTTTGAPFLGLQPVNVYMVRSGTTRTLEFIGSIKGAKFFPAWVSASRSAIDYPARWIDPNCAGYASMVANPLDTGDGYHYYTNGDKYAQYGLMSDNPDWW